MHALSVCLNVKELEAIQLGCVTRDKSVVI